MKKIELDAAAIQNLIETIKGLPEKGKRLFLGRQAISLGYGGISMVARAIKVSRNCIARGVAEVLGGASYKLGDRNRKPGGGRISVEESHRRLVAGMGFEGKTLILQISELIVLIIGSWPPFFTFIRPWLTRFCIL